MEGHEEEGEEQDPFAQGNFFGYIDENGVVVYLDLESDVVLPADEPSVVGSSAAVPRLVEAVEEASDPAVSDTVSSGDDVVAAVEVVQKKEVVQDEALSLNGLAIAVDEHSEQIISPIATETTELQADKVETIPAVKSNRASTQIPLVISPSTKDELGLGTDNTTGQSYLARYFTSRTEPSPRINPSLIVRGNTLYLYGGVTELGDIEVTLDDCWSIDLSKRDMWRKVLGGTMHTLMWKGEDGEGTEVSIPQLLLLILYALHYIISI